MHFIFYVKNEVIFEYLNILIAAISTDMAKKSYERHYI